MSLAPPRPAGTLKGLPSLDLGLNVGNVWSEGLRLDRVDHVTVEKAEQLSRYELATDDLLFARSGATLGK
ncbi:MAG: hypothetical protein QF507_08385, partial [Vicinamibacterales bacterium]|nr:hypothetical protein [Vicinamibacterales bacterium]